MNVLSALGRAIGDGLTLAAEVLCPRDHTAEDRLRSWESAAVAVEDEICDEADRCDVSEFDPTEWLPYAEESCGRYTGNCSNRCLLPEGHFGACDDDPDMHPDAVYARMFFDQERRRRSSAAVSAAADPSPADVQAAGDEGPEGASAIPPAAPSGQPTSNDASVTPSLIVGCGQCDVRPWAVTLGQVTRYICAEHGVLGGRVESDPGEVTAPSPGGEPPTCVEIVKQLANWTVDQGVPEWAQMLKVSEEAGEAAQAYLRHIKQPSKVPDPWSGQDVVYELADTAIAALVAIQRINHWDAEVVLTARLDILRQRYLTEGA